MATSQQRAELQTVLCGCEDRELHTLGSAGCTAEVKPGNWGSWKPAATYYRAPRIRVEEIYTELARCAGDKLTRNRYRQQTATARLAGSFTG